MIFLAGCPAATPPEFSRDVFVHNVYGEAIRQKSLPVKFSFDKGFPKEKYAALKEAATSVNKELGVDAIVIEDKIHEKTSFAFTEKDGLNTLYWGTPGNFMEKRQSEQARTSVFWIGNVIHEADIRFSPTMHSDFMFLDFDSLARHEFYTDEAFQQSFDQKTDIFETLKRAKNYFEEKR